jgi:hypothetical protein
MRNNKSSPAKSIASFFFLCRVLEMELERPIAITHTTNYTTR